MISLYKNGISIIPSLAVVQCIIKKINKLTNKNFVYQFC